MERVDLGPCTAIRHRGDDQRCVVLLPGQLYPTRAPVLWFAREALIARGWSTLEILGEPGTHADPLGWERECAQRALASVHTPQLLVIGKSLASLLAGEVRDRGLPAVWLTPLLTEGSVIEALEGAHEPTMLVGGTADPVWHRDAIAANPALEVFELAGVDHALQVPGDPSASLDALRLLTDAIGGFVGAL